MISNKDRQIFQKLFSNLSIAFRDAAQELEQEHSSSADQLNSFRVVKTNKMDDIPPSSTFEKNADLENDVANVTSSINKEQDDDDDHEHNNRGGGDVRSSKEGRVASSKNDKEEHTVVAPVKDSIDDSLNYHEMNRSQLQEICKSRNLRANGKTWELIERIIASETMEPRPPKNALQTFQLFSLERQSNSNQTWNPKCHSGKSMKLYLYICMDDDSINSKKYLFCHCQCGKQCLRAWPLGNSKLEKDSNTLQFCAADTSGQWVNYPCKFRAHFVDECSLLKFKQMFDEDATPFQFEVPTRDEDCDFQFQSQALLF